MENMMSINVRNLNDWDKTTFECCCHNIECDRLRLFNEAYRRMEHDAQLAAELGQALLLEKKDHESRCGKYAVSPRISIAEEENTLQQAINERDALRRENEKLAWNAQNAQEMIQLLQLEVKYSREHSKEMMAKLENYTQEISRLKLCEQMLSLKNNIENELRNQMDDLKQEITMTRRNELMWQNKHKRLQEKYEDARAANEVLTREHHELAMFVVQNGVLSQMKCYNEQLRQGLLQDSNAPPAPLPETRDPKREHGYPSPSSSSVLSFDKPSISLLLQEDTSLSPETITGEESQWQSHVQSSYSALQLIAHQLFERLCATDPRKLNRRLHRAFDMSELSDMSNSIIQNILIDIEECKQRFDLLSGTSDSLGVTIPSCKEEQAITVFTALLKTIQMILREVADLRLTLNDLQADYVRRIDQSMKMQTITEETEALSKTPDASWIPSFARTSAEPTNPSQKPARQTSWMSNLVNLFHNDPVDEKDPAPPTTPLNSSMAKAKHRPVPIIV
ncbi:uncharacterized protein BYT42DRAFT_561264 [Radiomyces spectabilis]|uniref:uncharacterized protein n=1 Tax=Radiomyces spectabilis TaxID=64574 RepID=UPI002220BF0F|nr:uncharacterized protein BYT42DRAFT_561264 [Radiomyces spectabilis]KAI8388798.1 hypothetical protein BYT42DRAFT_561264 [Radiomyces spectabilis]